MSYTTPNEWRNIRVTRHGAVTELRLHTEGQSLIWAAGIHRELVDAWTWLNFDEATRVVILAGTGDSFCTEIRSPSSEKSWYDIWWEGRRIVSGLVDLDVPVIALVNGPATIHAEIAVLADVVLACPEATFADHAHAVRGVVPGDGVQLVWRQLLGPSRANYFLLTGATLSSNEALQLGVVHEIHPREVLLDRALALAAPLSVFPKSTLAYTRASLRMMDRRELADSVSHGLALAGVGKLAAGTADSEPPDASAQSS